MVERLTAGAPAPAGIVKFKFVGAVVTAEGIRAFGPIGIVLTLQEYVPDGKFHRLKISGFGCGSLTIYEVAIFVAVFVIRTSYVMPVSKTATPLDV